MKKEEYPILQWKEKKIPEPIRYFPAQLKEQYGEAKEGWFNKIFWGDNIQVIGHLLKEYRGKIDLIYIDPPFDSKKNYKKKIKLKGKEINNDINAFEEKQYTDIWTNDEYLQFMYERLILLRELLSNTGTIYLHCDWHRSHVLRMIMDEIFGEKNFLNEIIWCYSGPGYWKDRWVRKHDNIYVYTRSSEYKFNPQFIQYKSGIHVNKEGEVLTYGGGSKESNSMELEKRGKPAEDWWNDIYTTDRVRSEMLGYPTQKPEKLLERIINCSTNEGDIVFDCFMGSGTTQAVAMKLGRRFIGADINLGAIQTTTKRLINIINNGSKDDENYYGFEVYNVNKHNSVKSEAEVCVVVENNKLKINDFFSMKLSQKMNIEKGKEDWRRFVEFIVIDLNYDGNVIKPSIIDIPSKNELVKGEYDIPSDVGKIKVKITDISLETFEVEII